MAGSGTSAGRTIVRLDRLSGGSELGLAFRSTIVRKLLLKTDALCQDGRPPHDRADGGTAR